MNGTGETKGEDRAIQAAEKAHPRNPLDEISPRGAKGVLINITGARPTCSNWTRRRTASAKKSDPDANIIVGSTLDTEPGGVMRVSVGRDRYRLRFDVNTKCLCHAVDSHRCQPERLR